MDHRLLTAPTDLAPGPVSAGRPGRRRARPVGRVAVAALAVLAAVGLAACDDTAATNAFYAHISELRAGSALSNLRVDPVLSSSACAWAEKLAAAGSLSHDPGLAGEVSSAHPGWRKLAENVGMGPSVDSVWGAFLASPPHHQALVDPTFDAMGVCTVHGGGRIFTVQRFAAL